MAGAGKTAIKESADFCVCGSNIDCQTTLPNDLWAADIDEGQIHQVLTNLGSHAERRSG